MTVTCSYATKVTIYNCRNRSIVPSPLSQMMRHLHGASIARFTI
jgi:hypothetical protein